MPFKPRKEPKELLVLKALHSRMDLPPDEKAYFNSIKKGYEGELQFDLLTSHLESKFYFLHDLRLEVNHSEFQIDTLIITQDTVILCDIKNHEGNYTYREGNFYKNSSQTPMTNPLHQLNRCKTLFQQYLYHNSFKFLISGSIIFINPEFFLYNAPQHEPIVFHPQLPSFLTSLSMKPSNLNSNHRKLAEMLLRDHIEESRHSRFPTYSYGGLKKGLSCAVCCSLAVRTGKKKAVCNDCGHVDTIDSAVVRSVEEIKLLFPDLKITTNLVYEWVDQAICKHTIRKYLKSHYKPIGYGKWFHYE